MGIGAKLRRLALNGIGRAVTPWLKPVDGQTPDPVMSVIAAAGQKLESQVVRLPAVAARDAYRRSVLQAIDTRPSLAIVEDLTIGGRASRLYKPSDDSSSPLLVYYHGGGGVIGDLDTADLACRSLAEQSRWSVLSIDYRLGPEDPYPAALDDAVAGFRAAIDEAARLKVDPRQVAVGGESFGAMLAAQVCRRVRRDGGAPPVGQLLIYPVCDHGAQTPSRSMFADGYILSQSVIDYFRTRAFAKPSDALDEWASPLRADDLSELPPALVVTAGLDMLRDEGRAYVERLQAAGVKAELLEFSGLFHDFGSHVASSSAAKVAWTTLSDRWASWMRT